MWSAILARKWVWLACYLVLATALKASTFGDLNRHADEMFYFLVGQRMHDGVLPYVDAWDRKPLGLFLIYYFIAGISKSVLSYQIVACLFSGTTAFVVALTARRWTSARGALTAGFAYLLMLDPFEGNTGQSPDFYNLFIATAACLLAYDLERLGRGLIGWRVWLAMALCAAAITIKQTTLFESLFFGGFVVVSMVRAGVPWRRVAFVTAVCALIGALPTLVIAACYWQAGHWNEFWQAMILSNLSKGRVGGEAWRGVGILMRAALLIAAALAGLWFLGAGRQRVFLAGWLVAAVIGFLAVPNLFGHYFLPVLVPLSVAAGTAFGRPAWGLALSAACLLYTIPWGHFWERESTRESQRTMIEATDLILKHDGGRGLFVYDGTAYLYATTGKAFLSPLVFPQHLNSAIERNVSHLDTDREIDRILAKRPGVIVMTRFPTYLPFNGYTRARVLAFVRKRCTLVGSVQVSSNFAYNPHMIFGDCRAREPG